MALKEFVGVVVSNKMLKTRIVSVDERVYHKTYKKVIVHVGSNLVPKFDVG